MVHFRYLHHSVAWQSHIAQDKSDIGADSSDEEAAMPSVAFSDPTTHLHLESNVPLIRARLIKCLQGAPNLTLAQCDMIFMIVRNMTQRSSRTLTIRESLSETSRS